MAIRVKCGSCGRAFRARSQDRGREARCPLCSAPLVIDGEDVAEQPAMSAAPYYAPPNVAAYSQAYYSGRPSSALAAAPAATSDTLVAVPRASAGPLDGAEIVGAIIGAILLLAVGSMSGYMIANDPQRQSTKASTPAVTAPPANSPSSSPSSPPRSPSPPRRGGVLIDFRGGN